MLRATQQAKQVRSFTMSFDWVRNMESSCLVWSSRVRCHSGQRYSLINFAADPVESIPQVGMIDLGRVILKHGTHHQQQTFVHVASIQHYSLPSCHWPKRSQFIHHHLPVWLNVRSAMVNYWHSLIWCHVAVLPHLTFVVICFIPSSIKDSVTSRNVNIGSRMPRNMSTFTAWCFGCSHHHIRRRRT